MLIFMFYFSLKNGCGDPCTHSNVVIPNIKHTDQYHCCSDKDLKCDIGLHCLMSGWSSDDLVRMRAWMCGWAILYLTGILKYVFAFNECIYHYSPHLTKFFLTTLNSQRPHFKIDIHRKYVYTVYRFACMLKKSQCSVI